MEQVAADRRYREIHEAQPYHDGTFQTWTEKPTPATPYHAFDGVTIFVAEYDMNPVDDFLKAPKHFPSTEDPEVPE